MTSKPPIDEARLAEALRAAKPFAAPDDLRRDIAEHIERDRNRGPYRFPFTARSGWIAAAAALLLAATGVFVAQPWSTNEPTDAEVAAAAAQLRLVLASASRAVRNAPAAALEHTLTEGVAPAMRRTPLAPERSGL